MKISKYFTIEELTKTNTGLKNNPNEAELKNLIQLAEFMDTIREHLGNPIIVNSAYRSQSVNTAVGGSKSSAHKLGLAIDFICPRYGTPYEICIELKKYFDANDIIFDQLIMENNRWVHLGLSNYAPRKQYLTAKKNNVGKMVYTPGINKIN